MHKPFLDHAREISRELYEDGDPVLNAQPESGRFAVKNLVMQATKRGNAKAKTAETTGKEIFNKDS